MKIKRFSKTSSTKAFTLIEMLVVIAIIAILATLTLPYSLSRMARQQIEEALALAAIVKEPVSKAWLLTQTLPSDNAAAGLPAADKIVNNYVKSVALQDGVITITFGNRATGILQNKVLTIRPAVVSDAPIVPVTWVCGSAQAPDKMTVFGSNQTNVPADVLPIECRYLYR